jgi:hypothetical protein
MVDVPSPSPSPPPRLVAERSDPFSAGEGDEHDPDATIRSRTPTAEFVVQAHPSPAFPLSAEEIEGQPMQDDRGKAELGEGPARASDTRRWTSGSARQGTTSEAGLTPAYEHWATPLTRQAGKLIGRLCCVCFAAGARRDRWRIRRRRRRDASRRQIRHDLRPERGQQDKLAGG